MATSCVGDVIGHRYTVIRELGRGAFGRVYLVSDSKATDDEQKKALKEVNVSSVAFPDPLHSNGTLQEARLQRRLNHPCIVQFYDSFFVRDKFYMCTEYCEGGDLDEKIQNYKLQGKRIEEEQIADWFVQMILGIRYIHKQKILHRDIKPKNLLLRNDIIKIADFGISKEQQMTLAHTCIGTPHYMSPEAVKYDGYNDKSDVWAVGCIIYELAAQKPLFDGRTIFEVFKLISTGQLSRWPRGYSKELQETFEQIMETDPGKRPNMLDVQRTPYVMKHMLKYNARLSESLKTIGIKVPDSSDKGSSKGETKAATQKAKYPTSDDKDRANNQLSDTVKAKETKGPSSRTGKRGKIQVVVEIEDPTTQDMHNLVKFIQEYLQDDSYSTLKDDSMTGAFNPDKREEKIRTVKIITEQMLGRRSFAKAYLFLKQARTASDSGCMDEADVVDKLKVLVPDEKAREYLDHLIYLETHADTQSTLTDT